MLYSCELAFSDAAPGGERDGRCCRGLVSGSWGDVPKATALTRASVLFFPPLGDRMMAPVGWHWLSPFPRVAYA